MLFHSPAKYKAALTAGFGQILYYPVFLFLTFFLRHILHKKGNINSIASLGMCQHLMKKLHWISLVAQKNSVFWIFLAMSAIAT